MSELIQKQQWLLQSLSRALGNFKKIGRNNYTPAKIRSRIQSLKETWTQCVQGHAALLHAFPEAKRETQEYFQEDQLTKHEEVYWEALDYMTEYLEELEPNVSPNQSMNCSTRHRENSPVALRHLPPIKLPPFAGNFEEWESFRDRFDSLITQNKELSDFSRMHFLASSLTGRAHDTIANLAITADNFEIAWKALTSRFENKRRLIETHVSSLYNLSTLSRESASDLHALRDKAEKAVAALKRLDRTTDEILSDILVYFVSQKLDPATRRAWKLRFSDDSPPPKYEDLNKFLSSRASALEELAPPPSSKPRRDLKVTSANASAVSELICPLCKEAHFINKCSHFYGKSASQRRELVKQHKRCFNCLSAKHPVSACPSKFSCRQCQQRHHSMLHVDALSSSNASVSTAPEQQSSTSNEPSQANSLATFSGSTKPSPVLLATARVIVTSGTGRSERVCALLDQGSEVSIVTESLAQSLRLRRVRTLTTITAIGCAKAGTCRNAAHINITSRDNSGPSFSTLAFVMPSLTNYTPRSSHFSSQWNHLSQLRLADDDPTGSDSIDLLIGADLYGSIILEGIRRGSVGQPIAQNSHFGWVISGPTSNPSPIPRNIAALHCSLERELRRFWEVEELPHKITLSPEEERCEKHFSETHSRDKEGRYIVRLPFKRDPPIDIGDSRIHAIRMLSVLSRRLARAPDLRREYCDFLSEYEELGHMEKVPATSESLTSAPVVYIPHHAVVRESSATTRLRVVFNASSQTSNGTSLNNHLLTGPKLQTDIVDVILRWRQYRYVYMADIAKMFRQIRVDPRDQDYQRILWTPDDTAEIQDFRLCTVTYGTASAPFIALRVIRQLVKDEGEFFPLAKSVLTDHIYVDDVIFGAEDIALLKQTRDQVRALLQRGGFKLRKWASNNSDLLLDISSDDHGLASTKSLQPEEGLNVLGIGWSPVLDVFLFKVSLPHSRPKTKRSILSLIARLFDPLGWATPVTIAAKIFIQHLWRLKLDWDDEIPVQAVTRWDEIWRGISSLNGLRITRWTNHDSDAARCELHGFADASTVAYAAVVYLRVTTLSGEITTTLLAGKSKVAPLKPLSVPRLELSATVLLSRLVHAVRSALNLTNVSCYCWTDSTVALAWLAHHPSRWKTFVAHRVETVQSLVPYAKWHHVATEDNPADCASRGVRGADLASHTQWWSGPCWLNHDQSEWPVSSGLLSNETQLEARGIASHVTQVEDGWDLASRYSSWHKLIRVTAYVRRFANRSRRSALSLPNEISNPVALSVSECEQAQLFWFKTIQNELFPHELKVLRQHTPLSSRNSILSLNPFLDESGLIRVGGRLQNANLPYRTKHPILMAAHPLVRLIVRAAHLRSLHAGVQLTLATIRREFWILRARNLVKTEIHRCVKCAREKAAIPTQLMGQLPRARVTAPARAFLHCGVDYAGPVAVRASQGRGVTSRKAYIAVFICLATRAIHLELVGGYSTSAFLDAYTRFCSRRGLPETMYSDNGTTFTGADGELQKAYREAIRDPDFLNRTASDRVSWKFIPPHAPHFGGLWEAGVRSLKHHLRRVISPHKLTFEEFTTLLCKIEACLNSRPLGPLSDSIEEYEPLTPGHFLIGAALTSYPEPSTLRVSENRLSRFQVVRQVTERFWRIWQDDYINTLQQRTKWRKMRHSIQVGAMVLIRNPTLPPSKWELGRVIRCHAGPDRLVRVVSVKTAHSEYKRPVTQLCLLPVDVESPPEEINDLVSQS